MGASLPSVRLWSRRAEGIAVAAPSTLLGARTAVRPDRLLDGWELSPGRGRRAVLARRPGIEI